MFCSKFLSVPHHERVLHLPLSYGPSQPLALVRELPQVAPLHNVNQSPVEILVFRVAVVFGHLEAANLENKAVMKLSHQSAIPRKLMCRSLLDFLEREENCMMFIHLQFRSEEGKKVENAFL